MFNPILIALLAGSTPAPATPAEPEPEPPAPPPEPEPLDPNAERLVKIARDALPSYFDSKPGSYVQGHGYAIDEHGDVTVLALGMSLSDARAILKERLPEMGAVAFVHVVESWSASAKEPDEIALIERLHAEGRLQDAPKHLLREVVTIWVETPDMPVRAEEVQIVVAEDGTRALGTEWVPKTLKYPRPTFRRYFPEVR